MNMPKAMTNIGWPQLKQIPNWNGEIYATVHSVQCTLYSTVHLCIRLRWY